MSKNKFLRGAAPETPVKGASPLNNPPSEIRNQNTRIQNKD